jgi:hypothetical protein
MNGYQYLIRRNQLTQKLETDLAAIAPMPAAERAQHRKRLEAAFDAELAALYAQVQSEYPGERRIKARPIDNPR